MLSSSLTMTFDLACVGFIFFLGGALPASSQVLLNGLAFRMITSGTLLSLDSDVLAFHLVAVPCMKRSCFVLVMGGATIGEAACSLTETCADDGAGTGMGPGAVVDAGGSWYPTVFWYRGWAWMRISSSKIDDQSSSPFNLPLRLLSLISAAQDKSIGAMAVVVRPCCENADA